MEEQSAHSYWSTDDAAGFHTLRNAQDLYVMQDVARIITEQPVETFLDYGCGNAYIDTILPQDIKKTLYDINPAFIPADIQDYNCSLVQDTAALPSASFDCILLSMVLVTVRCPQTYKTIIAELRRLVKPGGRVIVSEPHPCFRANSFRYLCTDVLDRGTAYFQEGHAFETRMRGFDDVCVSFTDYHHSLAFLVNTLAGEGLHIRSMLELEDKSHDAAPCNPYVPPYCVLVCSPA